VSDPSAVYKTREWYEKYYQKQGSYRNDLLRNPEVLFQTLASDASVIAALRSTLLDPAAAQILDVGCGGGGSIINFLRLGFDPSKIWGIDILPERIRIARSRFPNVNFICGDASSMKELEDNRFDLVFEATMFVQITDDNLSQRIADEMLRVAKTNGFIMLIDWRYGKPGNASYKALSQKRIEKLFHIGTRSEVRGVYKGALVPPVGRFISHRAPFVYFLVQTLFPFLVGQVTTVLVKKM
jgi:ubiquinone/menaquinone biosynthesis C-methylase UbiE